MTNITITQSTFSKGIASDSLTSRDDTTILVKSAYDIQNMVITSQGGLKKRHGIESILNLPTNSQIVFIQSLQLANNILVHMYQIVESNSLYLVFNNQYFHEIFNFGIIDSFTTSENNILFAPQFKELQVIGLNAYSVVDFAVQEPLFSYTPSLSSEMSFSLAGATEIGYFHIGSEVYFNPPITESIPNSNYIYANGLNIKVTANNYGVVVEGSAIGVRADKISELLYGFKINTNTIDFFKQRWSEANNTPSFTVLYNNRLFVGINNKIWASEANNTGNFVQLSNDDDQAFAMTLDTNVIITGLFVYKTLLVFTNLGIYAYLNSLTGAITPNNNMLSKISDHIPLTYNSNNYIISPTFLDNSLFYIEKNTFHVRQISFNAGSGEVIDIDTTRFIKDKISTNNGIYNIVNTNSINNGTGDSFIFAIQNTDEIFCLQSVLSDDISGWTRLIFNESIKQLSTINNQLYLFSNTKIYKFTNNYLDPNNIQIVPKLILNDISGLSPIGSLRFKNKKISKFNIQLISNYVYTQLKINNQEFNLSSFDTSIYKFGSLYKLITKIADNYSLYKFIEIEFNLSQDLEILGIEYDCEVE